MVRQKGYTLAREIWCRRVGVVSRMECRFGNGPGGLIGDFRVAFNNTIHLQHRDRIEALLISGRLMLSWLFELTAVG